LNDTVSLVYNIWSIHVSTGTDGKMGRLSTTIMTLEQEIGGLKKIIHKLLWWVHSRATDLYSEELEKLQQQRQEQEQKGKGG
jgi:hypothetical protein